MPKISGFDMLDILRSTTETKDVKVIIMTALSSEDQRKRGEQLGADKYLVKSQVGIEDVVRAVHEAWRPSGSGTNPVPVHNQLTHTNQSLQLLSQLQQRRSQLLGLTSLHCRRNQLPLLQRQHSCSKSVYATTSTTSICSSTATTTSTSTDSSTATNSDTSAAASNATTTYGAIFITCAATFRLGDRIIQPLPADDSQNSVDISKLMAEELDNTQRISQPTPESQPVQNSSTATNSDTSASTKSYRTG